jgi:hypothetical protein
MDINQISVSPLPAMNVANGQHATAQFSPAQQVFFRQLHTMLMNECSNSCVKWLDDSKGFVITDKDAFSDVLRRYFGEAKYASFTRRLKRWGFSRITKGPDNGAYFHPSFHRNMNFEEYDDIDNDMSCSPSESSLSLPPKKRRMMRSPDPTQPGPCPNPFDSFCHPTDVDIMPEMMRKINRSKRCENIDCFDSPAAKRAKFGRNESFFSNGMPRNFGHSFFGSSRYPEVSQAQEHHIRYLSQLQRQVFQENQGSFNSGQAQRCNFGNNNPMESLSNVSTEILKREIDLRQMQQRLHHQNNTNFNWNKRNNATNGCDDSSSLRSASSMKQPSYFNEEHNHSDLYAARALGALKAPNHSGGPMSNRGWNQDITSTGIKDRFPNFSMDSATVPIPGVNDMAPKKNPFNRAA